MEVISYSNIKVEGFPFRKIISLIITHNPNEHGTAEVIGEVDPDEAEGMIQRADETMQVSITTTAQGQPDKLFCGCVRDIQAQYENAYCRIHVKLYSMSRSADITKKNKTYQNTALTYGNIISEGMAEYGDVHMMVSDKAIGRLIMKYEETDWEFAKRMAAQLKAPLIAGIHSAWVQIYVGMPPASRSVSVSSHSYSYEGNVDGYMQTSETMTQDFAGEQVLSEQYAYLGDKVELNGKSKYIKSVCAQLQNGIMQIRYGLLAATAVSSGGSVAGIAAPAVSSQASGKMMKGIVQAVKADKVQVHLTEIDNEYDGGGTWWFPFSTAYSSSDGSGWYCMPEENDEVRVFFPSGNEGEAFAASSVCANPPSNPKNKSWKAPGGKEILLTDEGMYIIGNAGKIYINLTDANGVEIHSDKAISISSDAKVSISAADEVHIVAENEIIIGTEEAYIDLTKNTATLAASEVLIN